MWERLRRWERVLNRLLTALLPLAIGFFTAIAVFTADRATDRALAIVSGLAAATAFLAIEVARRTHAVQSEARLEEAAERRRRRLEAIAELVLRIMEAASSGGWDRWRLARRRLRIVLAALGPEVELEQARELAEVEPGQMQEGEGMVAGQLALDEIVERFAEFDHSPNLE